jgi:hypothetical protein
LPFFLLFWLVVFLFPSFSSSFSFVSLIFLLFFLIFLLTPLHLFIPRWCPRAGGVPEITNLKGQGPVITQMPAIARVLHGIEPSESIYEGR